MVSLSNDKTVMQSLRHLANTQARTNQAIGRLASGMRVNSAADDAAGLAMANQMTTNLRATSTLTRGINDGISLTQVAEAGLNSINELVQRSRELAVQAANGSLSDSDRGMLNQEFMQLRESINQIALSTSIYGKYPLAPAPVSVAPPPPPPMLGNIPPVSSLFPVNGGSMTFASGKVPVAYIPAGATNVTMEIDSLGADDDIEIFTRDGKHLAGTPILGGSPDRVWAANGVTDATTAKAAFLTEENGFLPTASYDASQLLEGDPSLDFSLGGSATSVYSNANGDMTIQYSGDGDRYESGSDYNDGVNSTQSTLERVNLDTVTEDLVLMGVGSGAFTATVSWDSMPDGSTPVVPTPLPQPTSSGTEIIVGASFGQQLDTVSIQPTPADSASLGLDSLALDPFEEARKALAAFDQALTQISGYRSHYGAVSNRLDSAIQGLEQERFVTSSALSRTMDADYAKESSELVKSQLLQQAGTSMLEQLHKLPQGLLSLLR